jgi:8-amino-7-oxononanoate synthase
MPSDFHDSFMSELEAGLLKLEEQSQRRSLTELHGVNLCSNDYLGLAENTDLKNAIVAEAKEATHCGSTGSRLLSGNARIWEELESEFAGFAGTEAALYFGSGYAANLGLLTSLLRKQDLVFSDALNHASLIDGIRLSGARRVILPHLDLDRLENALVEHASESCRKFIVTESVFSMDGDVADIETLARMGEKYGAGLIVDEAHATGVHGPSGRGIVAAAGREKNVIATVHTCGKALASAGAFVCGRGTLREHLINHARTFIFSTAMPPAMAGQIRAALRLARGMDAERNKLRDNARRFAAGLREGGWDLSGSTTQIVPAIVGGNEQALSAAEYLQCEGFAVRAIRPPTVPEGRARLRFSLTAAIPAAELERLGACLGAWRVRGETSAKAARG